jgi:pimeloyl-ACP methyl ester carboxylesterase
MAGNAWNRWLVLAWAMAAGCAPQAGDDGANAAEERVADAETAQALRAPVWGECPEGFMSECARLPVPLDWERPWGRNIELFVARYPAAQPARAGRAKQLWLLAGGPGGSGDMFAELLDSVFAPFRATHDIYVIEHRGVGESTRLGCPAQEALDSDGSWEIMPEEWPACLAYLEQRWGDDLRHFDITNAAKDLEYAIRVTRQSAQQVFVYGVSYGTLWAQRYLQLADGQADGVVLDSVVPPTRFSLLEYDAQTDPVAERLARLCARQPACRSKLGADPWAFLRQTLAMVDAGHCAELEVSRADLSQIGSELITSPLLRRHLFALMYRVRRCDPADLSVLEHYASLMGELPETLPRSSSVLQSNIALSELGTPTPDLADLEVACDEATFCPEVSLELRALYDAWPRYPTDRYWGRWFRTRTPILALNGDYDPQTPFEQASRIAPQLRGPGQNYVQLPYSPHFTLASSPVRDAERPTCGVQLMQSFLAQPERRPDTRCLSELAPIDFRIAPEESALFFGTPDAYENDATSAAPPANRNKGHDASGALPALPRAKLRGPLAL